MARRYPAPAQASVPGLHDDKTCPIRLDEARSHDEAASQYQMNLAVPLNQRGHGPYKNVVPAYITTSENLMQPNRLRNEFRTTFFSDRNSAEEYRRLLLDGRAANDDTIPQSTDQKKAHVKALYIAFKSVTPHCTDREDMKRAFIEERHDNRLVEVKCWEIFDAIEQRSLHTGNLVEAHEPGKFRFKPKEMNFAQRFDSVVMTMATSKTICKHLFDVPFVYKFIDDPEANRLRVESNRKLNGKKAEIMKRGKEEQEKDREAKRRKANNAIAELTDSDADYLGEEQQNTLNQINQPMHQIPSQHSNSVTHGINMPFAAPSMMASPQNYSSDTGLSSPMAHGQEHMASMHPNAPYPSNSGGAGMIRSRQSPFPSRLGFNSMQSETMEQANNMFAGGYDVRPPRQMHRSMPNSGFQQQSTPGYYQATPANAFMTQMSQMPQQNMGGANLAHSNQHFYQQTPISVRRNLAAMQNRGRTYQNQNRGAAFRTVLPQASSRAVSMAQNYSPAYESKPPTRHTSTAESLGLHDTSQFEDQSQTAFQFGDGFDNSMAPNPANQTTSHTEMTTSTAGLIMPTSIDDNVNVHASEQETISDPRSSADTFEPGDNVEVDADYEDA